MAKLPPHITSASRAHAVLHALDYVELSVDGVDGRLVAAPALLKVES